MLLLILYALLTIVLCAIAGAADAVMDTVDFKFSGSIFTKLTGQCRMPGLRHLTKQLWWNQSEGWKNKYKDRDPSKGRAFFGSMTFLVFVTDAWHFFQFIMFTALGCAICTATFLTAFVWWEFLLAIIAYKIIFGCTFELFFNKLWKKKDV